MLRLKRWTDHALAAEEAGTVVFGKVVVAETAAAGHQTCLHPHFQSSLAWLEVCLQPLRRAYLYLKRLPALHPADNVPAGECRPSPPCGTAHCAASIVSTTCGLGRCASGGRT